MRRFFPDTTLWLCMGGALLLAWLCYRPGLSGGFLFDDYANLPALGAYGPVDNATTFWRYITSGTADPIGRPLSLLTFLIDANDWPADVLPFKRTNVLLHLLNGALLAFLLALLGRPAERSSNTSPWAAQRHLLAAALGAALWLVHPFFVSTTLYIVQREAMLPATFTLLGLIAFVVARQRAASGNRMAIALAVAAIGVSTVLATLSKANGLLLPMLAGTVEWLWLSRLTPVTHERTRKEWRIACFVAMALPSALIAVYLARQGYVGFTEGIGPFRHWTLGERLLTEGRILVDYLRQLWLPRPYSRGLFNDGIEVSRGLLDPPTTLLSWLVIVGLVVLAIAGRRRWPAWSLAIVFFFAGHLMESTVLALELYFEHRNYLPGMLLFWPLALQLCKLGPTFRLRMVLALLLILGLAMQTWLAASLWGDVQGQGRIWADRNRSSARAQAYASQLDVAAGRPELAVARLQAGLESNPAELQMTLNLVGAKCRLQALDPSDLDAAAHSLRTTHDVGRLAFDWLGDALETAQSGTCPALDMRAFTKLLDAAESNPAHSQRGRRQDILHLRGLLALARNEPDRALAAFNSALDQDPRADTGLRQAAILGARGHAAEGLAHLRHMENALPPGSVQVKDMATLHRWLLQREGYWPAEIRHLRSTLQEDLAKTAPQILRSSGSHENASADNGRP